MQRTYLNTGDNEPHTRILLKEVAFELERKRGCHMIGPWQDETKQTAALIIQQGQQYAYVVARSTAPMGNIVSTQQKLIGQACALQRPIIMYVLPENKYYMFDPDHIRLVNEGPSSLNERFSVTMVNYNINLSREWNGQNIQVLYEQLRAATAPVKRARRTLLDFSMVKKE